MRGIVEDVLWEGGVLTTDEIYRGVKARHAQLDNCSRRGGKRRFSES